VERLRKELEVTKIVKGVPMGIKAVVASPPITSRHPRKKQSHPPAGGCDDGRPRA
jgi:hypothetical protein